MASEARRLFTRYEELATQVNIAIEESGFVTGMAYVPWTCAGVIGEFRVTGCPVPFLLTQGMDGRAWDDLWIEAVEGHSGWAPVCACRTLHGSLWQIGVDDMKVAQYEGAKAEMMPIPSILAVMATCVYVANQYGMPRDAIDDDHLERLEKGWANLADSTNDTSEFVETWKGVAADCAKREADAEADPAALARIWKGAEADAKKSPPV